MYLFSTVLSLIAIHKIFLHLSRHDTELHEWANKGSVIIVIISFYFIDGFSSSVSSVSMDHKPAVKIFKPQTIGLPNPIRQPGKYLY